MNYPVIEFPWLGNGMIIAIIAIIHVIVSHGVAIGMTVLMVSLEYQGLKTNNEKLINVAKTISKWVLIITTTVGAMTGVGIWLVTSVIQPDSIGSLLRIFFWAWFAEWLVFITEVVLLIIYYYTWDTWKGAKRKIHFRIGVTLSIFGWLTAMIITGILSAKLTPGKWTETLSFWNAFLNPTYIPSLAFRTFIAILLAVSLISLPIRLLIKDKEVRRDVFKVFSFWNALTVPGVLITGIWYLLSIPDEAKDLIIWSTGMPENIFNMLHILGLALFLIFALWMAIKPERVPVILTIAIFFTSIAFIGEFEGVRESVRKPYIIYDYLYANGIEAAKVDKFNEEGYLANSAASPIKEVTAENQLEAGRELYKGQCIACHTVEGWRTKRNFGDRLEGWDEAALSGYISTLHETRPFMPPFVGTDDERDALAAYLIKVSNEGLDADLTQGSKEKDDEKEEQ